MGRLFGTDGVRGLANADVTADLALRLGRAGAAVLGASAPSTAPDGSASRPVAVVGRDPRASGEMLEAAIVAGLSSAGMDVLTVGVVPTPALAYLTDAYDAALGVMISASHNAMPDNGIKFFAAGGVKLADEQEDRIEALLDAASAGPTGADIGRVRTAPDGLSRYEEHLAKTVPTTLDGITVVVDCAHGAASSAAPDAYRAAGATVVAINAEPTGLNINDGCGSTHLDVLQRAVLDHGADLGLAHDGDADRCLAVDAAGDVVDGDAIMAILALAMKDAGTLPENTLVATVMSNLGLHIAMREADITVRTTAVGDRYVLEELRAGDYGLGGEQSGHIVIPAFGSTGDGVLTGLQVMSRMASTGRPLRELAAVMRTLPQTLINVRVEDKQAATAAAEVTEAVDAAERELGDEGRVLLRPSGTEQLVRVMVEAADTATAERLAGHIAEQVAAVGR
ncbi:phosphoglucosamine mutase [Rhodococcoides corynebacterioides]|uniref:phosphoglucosamine mutase n=1 Tax=Rhodococcoides corynebacterioides TaxID=53972 RepID=UPI001C9AEE85|nr:phosphoglucosamine mutase [Rhodococcus corynebacterioides]MBY6350722.1 phosphoglucosamine mutase [Rhodococcus corynebacterioides]